MYSSLDDFVGDFNMRAGGLQIPCKISFKCSTSFGFVSSVISTERGGHYSCICGVETRNHTNFLCTWKILPMSLDDRQNLLQQGILWKKSLSGDFYPFRNLKKKELGMILWVTLT
jgi:hypothetical protein